MGEAKRHADRIAAQQATSEREDRFHKRAQRAEGDLIKAQAEIGRLTACAEAAEAALSAERAKVAAAYGAAAQVASCQPVANSIERKIRALVPADATAALEEQKRLARNEGIKAAAEIALNRHEAWNEQGPDCPVACDVTACQDISGGIRALLKAKGEA